MTTQAIFFDLDDTLCDFRPAWTAAMSSAFDYVIERRPEIDKELLEAAWARTWDQLLLALESGDMSMAEVRAERFIACFDRLGLEDDELAVGANLHLGSKMLDELRLFSDVACLEALRETWPLAIVTNGADDSHPDSQFSKADRLGLIDRVDGFFTSDSLGWRKPDPRLMLYGVEGMGFEPSRVLFVGDSVETDIVGANRAGLTSVLLWRSHLPPPELSGEQRPRIVIRSLSELVRWADFS